MTDQNGSNASVNAASEPASGPIPRHAEPDAIAPEAATVVPSVAGSNGVGRGRVPGDQETGVFPRPPASEATPVPGQQAPSLQWTPPSPAPQAGESAPRSSVPGAGQQADQGAPPPVPQFRQGQPPAQQGQAGPPQAPQSYAGQPGQTQHGQGYGGQQGQNQHAQPSAGQQAQRSQSAPQQAAQGAPAGQQGWQAHSGAPAAQRPQHGGPGSDPAGALPGAPVGASKGMPNLLKDGAQKASGSALRRTFGMGESKKEIAYRELIDRIRSEVPKFEKVGVFGSGGRKVVGSVVGQVFAHNRGGADRQIIADLDVDGSDLVYRTARNPEGMTLRDLLDATDLSSATKVAQFTGLTESNLQTIDGWWSASTDDPLDAFDVFLLDKYLDYHYAIGFYINGRGVQALPDDYHDGKPPAAVPSGAVLELTDVALIVAEATLPGVRRAGELIEWLQQHGYHELLQHAIVVINHTQAKPRIDVDATMQWFAGMQLRVREIPFDTHLNEGGEIKLDLLKPKTLRAFEHLAADVADDWSGRPRKLLPDDGKRRRK